MQLSKKKVSCCFTKLIFVGFVILFFLVNPKSWAKIPSATRAKVLNYVRNVEPPIYESNWKPPINSAYAAVDKAGLPGTKFSPEVTAKFNKIVYNLS